MTRLDQVISESGMIISAEDRERINLQAGRAANMTGGRYSDHLRSELATLAQVGSKQYQQMHEESARIARQLGY